MAWRVTLNPAVSFAMERGPSSHRRATSWSRVSSPNAANTGADAFDDRAATLGRMRQVFLDELRLGGPALVVHGKRLGAARDGDAIEAGLGDREQGAVRLLLEFEDDKRRRLAGVVRSRVDGERA